MLGELEEVFAELSEKGYTIEKISYCYPKPPSLSEVPEKQKVSGLVECLTKGVMRMPTSAYVVLQKNQDEPRVAHTDFAFVPKTIETVVPLERISYALNINLGQKTILCGGDGIVSEPNVYKEIEQAFSLKGWSVENKPLMVKGQWDTIKVYFCVSYKN